MIGVTPSQAGRQARLEGEDLSMSSSPKCLGVHCRAYGIMLASREMRWRRGQVHVSWGHPHCRHALSAGIHSGPVVWVGEFTHPAKQKTIRSIHAVDDFAKNWFFKQSGVTLI